MNEWCPWRSLFFLTLLCVVGVWCGGFIVQSLSLHTVCPAVAQLSGGHWHVPVHPQRGWVWAPRQQRRLVFFVEHNTGLWIILWKLYLLAAFFLLMSGKNVRVSSLLESVIILQASFNTAMPFFCTCASAKLRVWGLMTWYSFLTWLTIPQVWPVPVPVLLRITCIFISSLLIATVVSPPTHPHFIFHS